MGDVLGGIGGAIGGIIGNSDRDKATAALQQALGNYSNINPNVNMPQEAAGDPRTQAVQNQLLQQTLNRVRSGGLNASDTANVNNILGTAGAAARQAQGGAMQNAQQMGTAQGNSGILGAMVAGQNAANQQNANSLQAAGLANQAAMGNTQMGAQQAGQLRGQNIGVEQGNIERQQAQMNQNKMNEYMKAHGQLMATQPLAGQYGSNAQNTAAQWQGMGKGIGAIWDNSPWGSLFSGKMLGGKGGGGGPDYTPEMG